MRQNIYDQQAFFESYSQMERSKHGLEAAGEWHHLKCLLPDVEKCQVLDLGCGYGWHAKYLADNNPTKITAIDLSQKMIDRAIEINSAPNIEYQCLAIEEANFAANYFDLIISSLVIHYIADYDQLISNIYNWLKPGGQFIFSCEHPIFTASGIQDWEYTSDNTIKHFPLDNYSYEGERETNFLGAKVLKYHRTLSTYLNVLIRHGFIINSVVEPTPPNSMLSQPGMKDEFRRPMMLIISVTK